MVCMHSVRLRCHVRRGGQPRWVDLYQHFCIHRESWLFEFSFRLEKLGLHAPRALPLKISSEEGGMTKMSGFILKFLFIKRVGCLNFLLNWRNFVCIHPG